MRSSVLDSYAVLAFLFEEDGHETVMALFEKAAASDQNVLISAPNWAEVRYQERDRVCIDYSGWPLYSRASLPDEVVYKICAAIAARADEIIWDQNPTRGSISWAMTPRLRPSTCPCAPAPPAGTASRTSPRER